MPSRTSLLEEIEARMAAGEGFTVATLNLDHVVKLRRDPAFRRAYARHTHVVADGNPIVWLGRLAGQRVELAPGSELVDPVAAFAARLGAPVALLGSTEAVLDRAATELSRRHPGLHIVARIAPAMGFDPAGATGDTALAELEASGARLCFLALGAPKQEVFAVRAHERLPRVGFLSIGAGLDYIAGKQARAPVIARALAIEWLWRLGTSPRRLAGRYAACIVILPGLARDALRARREAAAPGAGHLTDGMSRSGAKEADDA
jgi:exopolysaccharide biosynthesis WecB/TagA/CpsF family protein